MWRREAVTGNRNIFQQVDLYGVIIAFHTFSCPATTMFPEEGEWTSVGKFLKIRRPALRVLEIAIDNPPYNLFVADDQYALVVSTDMVFRIA